MLQLGELFYRGKYQDILQETLETPGASWPKSGACYVIGALSFVGRIDDALVLMKKHQAGLDRRGLCAARFFVGIGLIRVSRYDEGVRFIAENLAELRREGESVDPTAKFYVYQGVAFYRFFQCRYGRALEAAKEAWAAALEADYPYGQSLASDLRGHAMVRTGSIAAGLKALDDSARLCERFGLGAQGAVVKTAQFFYRAQHGLFEDRTLEELETLIDGYAPEDNFTLAVTQCELARQLSVRGRVRESERYLEDAARVILKAGHKRHKAMVLHRLAHNRYYMGRYEEALEYLDKAMVEVAGRYSLDYQLQIEGLRLKIARRLGAPTRALEAAVARLTQMVDSGIGRNIAWRAIGAGEPTLTGDDILGDLRHRCRLGRETPYADILALLRAGMMGFLHEVVAEARESRLVCFDLIPKRVAVFDFGDVQFTPKPVSSTLKAVALQIARSPCTKKEMVEAHWGFVYHSLRHDPLVYAMINRLRQTLGAASEWLQHDGERYAWAPGVRVFTYEPPLTSGLVHDLTTSPEADDEVGGDFAGATREAVRPSRAQAPEAVSLNHRQIALLDELDRRAFLSAKDLVEIFGISRVTAFRDLEDLRRQGIVRRHGKGRASHYARVR